MSFNLPPGVTENDIPGNRPEDIEWESVLDMIDYDAIHYGFTPFEFEQVWKRGLESFGKAHNVKSLGY